MPYIAPYRSQLRPYNHAYAYRGLTAFATLSMAVSDCDPDGSLPADRHSAPAGALSAA
ncbi:MAG: hypothetical protein ABW170_23625 [Candidatus Thiodiazotropha sp. L084R]